MYIFEILQNLHFFAGVLVPFFTLWGGMSFTQIMILQAIFTFSIFALEVPTGTIADKFGRRISLSLAGVAGMLGALIYVSYPNFWVFALAEFVFGIGIALASGADQAMIYDSLKQAKREKESKKIFSRWGSMMLISLMIAAPVGSLIGKYFGLKIPMLLTAVPFLMMSIIALTLKEPPATRKNLDKDYFKILISGVKYLKEHKILKILAFDFISLQVIAFFVIWVNQFILQEYNVSITWFGFVQAAIIIGEMIVLNSFMKFEKIVGGKKRYLLFTAVIVIASYLVMVLTKNIYITVIAVILIGSFGITRKPLFASYFNKYIDSHNRATVLSAISMVLSLVTTVFNIFFGRLVDWNFRYALLIMALLLIVFTIFSKTREEHLID
jgi:MFS family permease